jgi:hypothetical protein
VAARVLGVLQRELQVEDTTGPALGFRATAATCGFEIRFQREVHAEVA